MNLFFEFVRFSRTRSFAWSTCLALLFLTSASAAFPQALEEENATPENPDLIVHTPVPTFSYGLRPTYRPSRSEEQHFLPELAGEEGEESSDKPEKSKEEQELDEVYGR